MEALSDATSGMSGADLAQIVDRAAYSAARRAAEAQGVALAALSRMVVAGLRIVQTDLSAAIEELATEKKRAAPG